MATDEGNSWNEIGHWDNDEIGIVTRSWLWVHVEADGSAQLVRASEWNSVAMFSNPNHTQPHFL